MLRTALAAILMVLVGACDPSDGPTETPAVDAAIVQTDGGFADAPFLCTPVTDSAPVQPAVCLALAPSALQGATPFGPLDLGLDYFGAGDCITISRATVVWRGACGEALSAHFSYPVTSDTSGRRRVVLSFDTVARFELQPPGATMLAQTATVHVDVAQWHEGDGIHDIDITIAVTDPAYSLAPMRVQGTFCDWPYYLC